MEWETSKAGNTYVAIDGEGVGNDYVLLDSSIDSVPRLYTGNPLRSEDIFNWLWHLGNSSGKCLFVLYGASYDYNNWVRDLSVDDAKIWAKGGIVRIGDYYCQYMRGFRFELRKVKYEVDGLPVYDRIRYGDVDLKKGMLFYDVLPFWQTSFIKALEDTLGEHTIDSDLIEAGKSKRGEFTHDEIEWVSRYNKAECYNLVEMCKTLDGWFTEADIHPRYMNGPGAAAKAVLRDHDLTQHNGRFYLGRRPAGYDFPGIGVSKRDKFLDNCMRAYAGGRNQQTAIGFNPGANYQYDKISAYPSACRELPCLSHGQWKKVTGPTSPTAFGIYRISYSNRKAWLHPYFVRLPDDYGIVYPYEVDRWIWNSELQAGLQAYGDCTQVHEGYEWIASGCDNPYPFNPWVEDMFLRRKQAKADGNVALSLILKLPLNSIYGSVAQSRGGSPDAPPPTQQILWAGWITGSVRGQLFSAAMCNPNSVCHLATDGLLSTSMLDIPTGDNLGDWEVTELEDLTVVGYGVYAATEVKTGKFKYRTRGFTLGPDRAEAFFKEVHNRWIDGWDSITVEQKQFITAGLAHESVEDINPSEWCSWRNSSKQIQLSQTDDLRGSGSVETFPGMYRVREYSVSVNPPGLPFASVPYVGHWGRSIEWPEAEVTIEGEYQALDWN
jgi:DNA polymerase type B, organellar and viral